MGLPRPPPGIWEVKKQNRKINRQSIIISPPGYGNLTAALPLFIATFHFSNERFFDHYMHFSRSLNWCVNNLGHLHNWNLEITHQKNARKCCKLSTEIILAIWLILTFIDLECCVLKTVDGTKRAKIQTLKCVARPVQRALSSSPHSFTNSEIMHYILISTSKQYILHRY